MILAMLALGCAATAVHARPHVVLRVRVDNVRRTVDGRLVADIDNPTDHPLDHLELWRFPARLERRSPALQEHAFYWVYPRSFDAGAMEIGEVRVDGRSAAFEYRDHAAAGAGTLVEIRLDPPLPSGGRARIEAVFRAKVPRRYGAFGCYERTCTLAGGFYPMPVQLDARGYDREAPPARADIDIQVDEVPGEDVPEVLVDGVRTRSAHLDNAAWATVIVSPHFEERHFEHRGVRVTYFHHGRGAPAIFDGDGPALLFRDLRDALDLLAELDFALPQGSSINLVETALRTEIAEPQAGAVLVSDQIYRMLPLARFRKFHSFQLVRAVYAMLFERFAAASEAPRDLAVSPDAGASLLVDRYTLRTWQKPEFAKDILRWFAFVPSVDKILYAPQVQFAAAYFNTLDEPNPTRDDLRRFTNALPRGKVIYEKLRDLVGDDGTLDIVRRMWKGEPLRSATRAVGGADPESLFAQWMGPYPEVDYRWEILRSERGATGQVHFIRVYKVGAHPPVEPVELRVTEWGGARHDLKWDGRGSQAILRLETRRSIQSIVLDPRGRLVERIASVNEDLRLDNRSPQPVKFIYNNLGALLNLVAGALDLSVDFSLSRVHDVKNSVRLAILHNEATQIGGLVAYSRHFGRFITPGQLAAAATTSLRVSRLDSSFARAGEPPQPGTRISLGVGTSYDDRFFVWEPTRYLSASVGATYSLTVLDSRQVSSQISVGADVASLIPIAPGHGVALEARVAATFGDLRVPSQALFAGGFDGLRGYQPDELPGSAYLMLRGEYRHTFVHDLNLNLGTIAFLRGIAGSVFVEGAAVAPCDGFFRSAQSAADPAHDVAHNIAGDAGYSIRLLGDWLGVSQTQFNLDVAVPLTRFARTCLPAAGDKPPPDPSTRFPVGIYFYFGPSW